MAGKGWQYGQEKVPKGLQRKVPQRKRLLEGWDPPNAGPCSWEGSFSLCDAPISIEKSADSEFSDFSFSDGAEPCYREGEIKHLEI